MTAVHGQGPVSVTDDVRAHDDILAHNADFDWDSFGPAEYYSHNYATRREDDADILEIISKWFVESAGDRPLHGLDIGSGANLYPTLAMLRQCETVTLREFSADNVKWLGAETAAASQSWEKFWEVVVGSGKTSSFEQARIELAEKARVEQGSIFDLPKSEWDIGTMFFVAESLTEVREEFLDATHCFIGALRPGAPFAAAFMERSQGWNVGPRKFPAFPVTEDGVREALGDISTGLQVTSVEIRPKPLRPGYSGMIIAIGRVKADRLLPA